MLVHKLTKQKIEELKAELNHLEIEESPLLSEELKKQREDTQDEYNSDLTELLEEKDLTKKRIIEIRMVLGNCEAIDENSKSNVVEIGTVVKVTIDGKDFEYRLVEAIEANPLENKISSESPIGSALVGRKVGDIFTVLITDNEKKFEIKKVSY
jgi:transcription elongation factor GreA